MFVQFAPTNLLATARFCPVLLSFLIEERDKIAHQRGNKVEISVPNAVSSRPEGVT